MLLDIETAPHLAAVWGLFKENIPLDRLMSSGYTMCWSAKWYGSDEVLFDSVFRNDEESMLINIHALLDEADFVIHYNGKRFDIPTLNREFLKYGMLPPSPYKQIDLLTTVRRQFRLASNKLDYVAKFLGIGAKVKHKGYELWRNCMAKKKDAWAEMEEYNIQDTMLLEKLYNKLKPWITDHPNVSLFKEELVCPTCGSGHYTQHKTFRTASGKYNLYSCDACGTWMRDNSNQTARQPRLVRAK